MKALAVQIDDMTVNVHEFTLDNYPESQVALEGLYAEDKTARRDSIRALLKASTDLPDDKMGGISLREWKLILDAITEVNGFQKKDKAPAAEKAEEAGAEATN